MASANRKFGDYLLNTSVAETTNGRFAVTVQIYRTGPATAPPQEVYPSHTLGGEPYQTEALAHLAGQQWCIIWLKENLGVDARLDV